MENGAETRGNNPAAVSFPGIDRDDAAQRHRARSFIESAIELSPGTKEFLYRIDPPPLPRVTWETGSGEVNWNDYQSNEIQIRSRSAGGGVLNVLVNAIPGWHCEIDGSESPIQSTVLGWIRVPVRAGDHTIQLSYRPPGLIPGAALAFAGLVLAVILSRQD
jgi:membrane protein YfhO